MNLKEKFLDEKIKKIASNCKVIFDIGGATGFRKELNPYKEYFSECDYKTVDINEKFKPDIVADIHKLPMENDSADGVICISVLEHVENPFTVVDEIYRILRTGGKVFVYVPFIHAYHGSEEKGDTDYWRFSDDGIRYLFRKFNKIETCPVSGHFETMSLLVPRQNKFPMSIFVTIGKLMDRLSWKAQSHNQVSGHYLFAEK